MKNRTLQMILVALLAAFVLYMPALAAETGAVEKLDQQAFSDLFVAAVTAAEPTVACTRDETMTVLITLQDDSSLQVNLENVYAEYLRGGQTAEEALAPFVHSFVEIFQRQEKQELKAADILPVIKPAAYIDDVIKNGVTPVYEPLGPEGLFILYVQDTPTAVRPVNEEEIAAIGMRPEALRDIAIQNLMTYLTEWAIYPVEGIGVLQADGMYEASFLLLNPVEQLSIATKGDLVVAVPSRDAFFIADGADMQAMQLLAEYSRLVYESAGYPVTDRLMVWRDGVYEYLKN